MTFGPPVSDAAEPSFLSRLFSGDGFVPQSSAWNHPGLSWVNGAGQLVLSLSLAAIVLSLHQAERQARKKFAELGVAGRSDMSPVRMTMTLLLLYIAGGFAIDFVQTWWWPAYRFRTLWTNMEAFAALFTAVLVRSRYRQVVAKQAHDEATFASMKQELEDAKKNLRGER